MSGNDWNYFDKFSALDDKYLPSKGDGTNMATQAVTAICKLVYKWFNDGDVYDNHNIEGWCNDISGSANWLHTYIPETRKALDKIWNIYYNDSDAYTEILKETANIVYDEELLSSLEKREKVGDAYDEEGPFSFEEFEDEEEDW